MNLNLSTIDRAVRVLVAALFIYLYFAGIVTGALGVVFVVLGGVFVLTAAVGFCPLYALFKVSTRKS